MTRAGLVWANLRRHRRRTILTTISVAIAMFLFATLRSFGTTIDKAGNFGSGTRMVVRHATAIVFPLQMSYAQRLAAVPGVTSVSWASWFGGTYRDPKDFFANFAVDGESFLKLYPEIIIPSEQKDAWLHDRSGAVVGVGLMKKFGWHLGQNVVLTGTIYPGDWPFTIRAVYTAPSHNFDELSFLFHYAYLDERTAHRAQPGWFYLGITDPARAGDIARTVDAEFKNSTAPTKTMTEKAFQASWVGMFSNIRTLMDAIGLAVVFAILLVTGNAMMMSARERTGEVAVLKTIGFSERTLVMIELAEAGIVAFAGALLGVGGSALFWGSLRVQAIESFLPGFGVARSTMLLGATIALGLTLVSGMVPAWRAARMSVIGALRTVE